MSRRSRAAGGTALLLLLNLLSPTFAEVGSPGFPPPSACARAGLLGACNGCVCCCGEAPGKPTLLVPDGCACVRELDRIDSAARTTLLAGAGGAVLAVVLLAAAWFGRCCCGSPYEEDAWEEV
jgi:hypothetical protein